MQKPTSLSLLLHGLRQNFEAQGLRAIAANSAWLLFDKLMRVALGLVVSAWVARYLNPAQFGQLAYVIAYVALFQAVARLGLDGIVVRDIARTPEAAPVILGTVFAMRTLAGVACWLAALAILACLNGASDPTVLLVALAGGALLFQAADTIDLWFQSQSRSRSTVLAKLVANLLSNGIKVGLIVAGAALPWFALVIAVEALAAAISLAVVYAKSERRPRWSVARPMARALLRESWPFLLGSFSVMIYMRIDQLMIREMLGNRSLGIYAAALSISQLWHVIPTSLVISLAPYVARKKAAGEQAYNDALLLIFRAFGVFALAVSVLTALLSPLLVRLMFGADYAGAAAILAVHVFSNVFVFQGLAQSLWLTNEGAGHIALRQMLLGGVAAILANFVLLPVMGPLGAAVAALVSYGISAVFSNAWFAPKIFSMQFGRRPRT